VLSNEACYQKNQTFPGAGNKKFVHHAMADLADVLRACMKKYITRCKDCAAGDADQPGNSSLSQFKAKAVKLSFFTNLYAV
jgi:hypothetical protein